MAEDLRCIGRADLDHSIAEALADDPLTDDHVAEVTDRLIEVMNDPRVPDRDRHRARQLIAVFDDLLGAIGRRGVVHKTWRRTPTGETGPERWARPVLSESDGIYQGSWGDTES